MKLDELIEIAKKGQLTLQIHNMGRRSRIKYIWDEKGEHIIGSKQIYFDLHTHNARCEWQAEHESYRINKKDYKILEKIINGME